MGPKTKIYTLENRALKLKSFDSFQNRMKNYRVMPIRMSADALANSGIQRISTIKWQLAYLGRKLAILATFFKISNISTSNSFCPSLTVTLRLICKPN